MNNHKVSRDSRKHHGRRGHIAGNAFKERDDDLALFNEMRKREKERNSSLLLPISDEYEPALAATKMGSSPIYKIPASTPMQKEGSDDFLAAEGDKNDYDWLLTPPGTPLFPSLEMEAQAMGLVQRGTPIVHPLNALKTSRLSNSQIEPMPKTVRHSVTSCQTITSSGLNDSTNTATRKPSTTSTAAPVSSKPSTPTAKSVVTASRSSSRSCTPIRRSSTAILSQNNSASPGCSSSVSKASTMPSRNSAPSRGTSPTVKSQSWQPSAIPRFSLETLPNLRTAVPERSVSVTRGRPGAPSSVQLTPETPSANNKPRGKSCSPRVTRGKFSNDNQNDSWSSSSTSKSRSNGSEGTVSVVPGSKMVEKVMNARRAATLGMEGQSTTCSVTSTLQTKRPVKPISSQDSTGFGRTLPKKSLDVALRHMDIRQSTPSSFQPHMSNIPTSSLCSVRLGTAKSKPNNISGSLITNSSNVSSEYSESIAPGTEGNEFDHDDDFVSEGASKSSTASGQDSFHYFKGDVKSTNWLFSPDYREDKNDHALFFDQGFEILSDPSVVSSGDFVDYESKFGIEY